MIGEYGGIALVFAPQDWEDSHTQSEKWIVQHLLLPHEVVGCFLREGETQRMIGSISRLLFLLQCITFLQVTRFLNDGELRILLVFLAFEKGSSWFQKHPVLSVPRLNKLQYTSSVKEIKCEVVSVYPTHS